MEKEAIKILVGDTTELLTSTAELLDKTSNILADNNFSNEEGTLIIKTLYETLDEMGNKMPKYLINYTCSKLFTAGLDTTKIEKWYETITKE